MSDRKREYSELLKDPRWQKLRLQVFERDGWACQHCGEKDKMLAVHHKQYKRGKNPWEYPIDWLTTLCPDCHQLEYEARKSAEDMLIESLFNLAGFRSTDVHDFGIEIASTAIDNFYGLPKDKVLSALLWILRRPDELSDLIDLYERSPKHKGRRPHTGGQ